LLGLSVVVLGGCDLVLGLSRRPDDGTDAGIDAPKLKCVSVAPFDHDEDGDAVTDICDPCPGHANELGNSDADALTDSCDPHPSVDGDFTVSFHSFADTETANAWTRLTGTGWTVDDDELRFSSATSDFQVIQGPPYGPRLALAARIVVDAAPTGRVTIGAMANIGVADDGVTCAIKDEVTTTVYAYDNVAGTTAAAGTFNRRLQQGSQYLVELRFDSDPTQPTATCQVTDDAGQTLTKTIPLVTPIPGNIGFEASAISAHVAWAHLRSW